MFVTRRITTSGGGDVFRDEYSLAFDGTDDNIRIPEIEYSVHDADFSFVFWCKRAATNATHVVLGSTAASGAKHIRFTDSGVIEFESDTAADAADITLAVDDTNWHHYVVIASSGTVTAYQDRVSLSVSGDVGSNNVTFDTIAGQSTGGTTREFNGNISEIAVYNIALSSNQVNTIYNGREPYNHKEGVASGNLQAWWRMGDGSLDEYALICDETNATLGSDLITNGGFDADSDWVHTRGNWEISSGTLNTTSETDYMHQGIGEKQNMVMLVTYSISSYTSGSVKFRIFGDSSTVYGTARSSVGTFAEYILFPSDHNGSVGFQGTSSFTGSIDNVSVKKVGDNAGIMNNMSADDFEGDTP
jgi:hypothetical protein